MALRIGIDIGSTTVKVVVLDAKINYSSAPTSVTIQNPGAHL